MNEEVLKLQEEQNRRISMEAETIESQPIKEELVQINGTISRSAMECSHACMRKRFLSYEIFRGQPIQDHDGQVKLHGSGGISPLYHSVALFTGTCVHHGFGRMLTTLKSWEAVSQLIPWQEMRRSQAWHTQIDTAVAESLQMFDQGLVERGISFGIDKGNEEFYKAEQRALIEGLLWVAGLRLIPELVNRYRIIDIEREERMELEAGLRQFAARADSLLADRQSEDFSVFSLKTAAAYGMREEMRFKRDVQGLSEAIAIERRLETEAMVYSNGEVQVTPEKVETVQMALLLKGIRRKQSEDRGARKEHYSPLLRAWRQIDPINNIEQWAWSYETPKVNKGGEAYMGRLGKEWKQAQTWEYPGGIRAWVLALDRMEIQPESGDALLQCLALPEPWSRSESEVQDWIEQAQSQERLIQAGAAEVNSYLIEGDLVEARRALNYYFPQNRGSCVMFNANCAMDGICWGSGGLEKLATGIVPEGFRLREDHHEESVEED